MLTKLHLTNLHINQIRVCKGPITVQEQQAGRRFNLALCESSLAKRNAATPRL